MGLVVGLFLATQLGAPPSQAGTNEAEAARLFQMASAAAAAKEYGKAARLFEKAYAFDPAPSLLMNAAQAHEADLNDARARMLYWQALNHTKVTPEQKRSAQLNIARLEGKLRKKGKTFEPFPTTSTGGSGNTTTTTTTSPTGATKTTTTTTTKTVGTPPPTGTTTSPSGSGAKLKSGTIVRVPRPDVEEAYMLSAMHCRWNGPTGRFTQCSSGHAWGGSANFEIALSRSRAVGNGLTIGFQNTYKGKPFCSAEFTDIAVLKRVNAGSSNVTIWLHNPSGDPKNWNEVTTWITVVCHGVD